MRFFYLVVLYLSCLSTAVAQDLQNSPERHNIQQKLIGEGSPYLIDAWSPADIKLANGTIFKDVPVKYDLTRDELTFKGKTGEVMLFTDTVTEFTIHYVANENGFIKKFRKGYFGIPGSKPYSFFELLCDGKMQLIKRTTKADAEVSVINTNNLLRRYIEKSTYYLVSNGQAREVRSVKAIVSKLTDKRKQMDDYLKTNPTSFRSDASLDKMMIFYNSL